MKKLYISLLIGMMGLSLSSCGENSSSIVNQSIEGPSHVNVGDVVKYKFNSSESYFWNSSDESILEIANNGEAVAFKEGKVNVFVTNQNKDILSTLEVVVENRITVPTTSLEISNLFGVCIDLEKEVINSTLEINDTYIHQTRTEKAEMYTNFYTIDIEDHYENYAGKFDEKYTEYRGIKDGYYYDLSLKDQASYAIKRKIVDSNQTDYEILRSEAEGRLVSPRFVNSFYSKLATMWGPRTLDLKITSETRENGFVLNLENTYLFKWANGVDNDSKYYQATLHFSNDGFFLNGEFKEVTYAQSQYDVESSSWKENAVIDYQYDIKYSAVRGEKTIGENIIIPEDYFVQEVTLASYEPETPLTVGGRINSDYIVLKEYQKPSAIDINNILILDVKNEPSKTVIIKDEVNGGYVAVSSGTCHLLCQMMYSSEVTFLVEVTVL